MAKWHELTEEQREILRPRLISAGIPLLHIPKMEFNLDDHSENE
jgi:hypothetical protein